MINRNKCIPGGYRGALIITWDYELQRGADSSMSGRKSWGMDDYTETKRLLKVLERYAVRCTFFCLGYAATGNELPYSSAEQIREISERGHEIGSHAFNHENIPGITYEELKKTLVESKQILEGIIDKPVISFAPPWNSPTQYLRRLSVNRDFSRQARRCLEISDVAKALYEARYKTYRVWYETLLEYIKGKLSRRRKLTHNIEIIHNIYSLRLSCPAGFTEHARDAVEEAFNNQRIAVIYAHPHSLKADNPQNIKNLIPFLEYATKLRDEGKLWIGTQRQIYEYVANEKSF